MNRNMARCCLLLAAGFLLSCCVTKEEELMKAEEYPSIEQEILQLAQTAASSHNSQPWRLEIREEGGYRVMAVEERWLREVDPEKREYLLSLGAYLENLKIAAAACGYDADMTVLLENRDDKIVAELTLHRKGGNRNEEQVLLMRNGSMKKVKYRRTLRNNREWSALVESEKNALWIERDNERFTYLAEGTVEANRLQAENDGKQSELADYICFSEEDEAAGIGMTPAMLNLPALMVRSWYRKASPDTVMSSFFRSGAVGKARKLMKNSAGILLLTSEDNSPRALLACGGLFQKLYWEGKRSGIELHTVSQILEESPQKEELARSGIADKPIQFLLRVGETDAVSSASLRETSALKTVPTGNITD